MIACLVSPFWLSISIMVTVLFLVAYIVLAMVYEAMAGLVRNIFIAYTSIGGMSDGENDD